MHAHVSALDHEVMAEVVADFHETSSYTGQVVVAVIFYLANASSQKPVAWSCGFEISRKVCKLTQGGKKKL